MTAEHALMRVIDHHVRWAVERADRIGDLEVPEGLRLAAAAPAPWSVHDTWLDRCLPDPRLAPTGDGGWLLVHDGRLTRLAPCAAPDSGFAAADLDAGCGALVAVAAGPLGMAILAREPASAVIVEQRTLLIRRTVAVPATAGDPRLVAWLARQLVVVTNREVIVLAGDGRVVSRHVSGVLGHAERIGMVRLTSGACEPVVAVSVTPGWSQLFRLRRGEIDCQPLDPARVCCADIGTVASWPAGFCLTDGEQRRCFTDAGEPCGEPDAPSNVHQFVLDGSLSTVALDGGRDDTNWGRVRIDATTPSGTEVRIRAASVLTADAVPDDAEWRDLARGTTDAQLGLPPRRYLRLRVDLAGDGHSSPVVHRIRVDLDAPSTIDMLPAVYRREPTSADFTRRLLALFDAELEDADDVIDRTARMLDPAGSSTAGFPGEQAEWHDRDDLAALAALVGVDVDVSWPVDRVRKLLQRPALLARRGSATGLAELVGLLFDVPVHVEEHWRRRAWGAIGQSRLDHVRLYTRAALGVRLGVSRLGTTPIDVTAVPERSAHSSGGFRAVVHVGGPQLGEDDRAGLLRTVAAFTPAHVDTAVRFAAGAGVLGTSLLVGVDTRVGAPTVAALRTVGPGCSARLGSGVLHAGRGAAVTVGRRAQVGVDTTV